MSLMSDNDKKTTKDGKKRTAKVATLVDQDGPGISTWEPKWKKVFFTGITGQTIDHKKPVDKAYSEHERDGIIDWVDELDDRMDWGHTQNTKRLDSNILMCLDGWDVSGYDTESYDDYDIRTPFFNK